MSHLCRDCIHSSIIDTRNVDQILGKRKKNYVFIYKNKSRGRFLTLHSGVT